MCVRARARACVSMCVCEREKERQTDRHRKTDRERERFNAQSNVKGRIRARKKKCTQQTNKTSHCSRNDKMTIMFEDGGAKMKLNTLRRRTLHLKNSWKEATHEKLPPDRPVLQDYQRETLAALASLQRGLNFCIRGIPRWTCSV